MPFNSEQIFYQMGKNKMTSKEKKDINDIIKEDISRGDDCEHHLKEIIGNCWNYHKRD